MSIFAMFGDRASRVRVNGKREENAVIMRRGKTINPQVIQYERMCALQDDTVFESGDLMESDAERYYIVAKQVSQMGAVQAHLRVVNTEVEIVRLESVYDEMGNETGEREVMLFDAIPSVQYTVSAAMKLYDAGLLPETVKKYILPEIDIRLQDRIKVDGNCYEVTGVNNDKYSNILEVQCRLDTRKTIGADEYGIY